MNSYMMGLKFAVNVVVEKPQFLPEGFIAERVEVLDTSKRENPS